MKSAIYVLFIDFEGACIYGFNASKKNFDCGVFRRTTFIGERLPADWSLPKHKLEYPNGKLRDFIAGYSQAPFVSERAVKVLGSLLKEHVEFREIGKINNTIYYVMNVLTLIDCLDLKKSQAITLNNNYDQLYGIRHYEFRKDKFESISQTPVFKLPQYRFEIYVNDIFVRWIRENRLTGVGFEDPNNKGITNRNCVFSDLPIRE